MITRTLVWTAPRPEESEGRAQVKTAKRDIRDGKPVPL
jgi:hypothetical protein